MKNKIYFFFSVLTAFVCLSCATAQTTVVKTERIKYELPEITDSTVIVNHLAYTLSYKGKYEQAEWVAYLLTKDMLTNEAERGNNFRIDPDVVTGSARPDDYKKSGYDKGHLAPAADMSFSVEAMSESFYMSNMSPQKPGFNRGVWKRLEELVRESAKENDSIYIATGPILRDGLATIGIDKVAVPEYYYKVIVVFKHDAQKGIGFILANKSYKEKLETFAITIDTVENLTGINFFEKIPKIIQDRIESERKVEEWMDE